MKNYRLFALGKLKMWIGAEVFFLYSGLSMVAIGIVSFCIGADFGSLIFGVPFFLFLFVAALIMLCKDGKALSRTKKAGKDSSAVLKMGKFIRAKVYGIYQAMEVEVDGQTIFVTPKIPSWSYTEYYRVNREQIPLLFSKGDYYILEER